MPPFHSPAHYVICLSMNDSSTHFYRIYISFSFVCEATRTNIAFDQYFPVSPNDSVACTFYCILRSMFRHTAIDTDKTVWLFWNCLETIWKLSDMLGNYWETIGTFSKFYENVPLRRQEALQHLDGHIFCHLEWIKRFTCNYWVMQNCLSLNSNYTIHYSFLIISFAPIKAQSLTVTITYCFFP